MGDTVVGPGVAGSQSTYRSAGVDTAAQDAALSSLAQRLRGTWSNHGRPSLDFGHYANIITMGPVGVAISTDGIGTKALIAQLMDKYDTVGIDCVAMNVNDVLCVGAVPQTMVDYIAVERIDPRVLTGIGKGLADGASQAGISIIGGETAQLPEVIRGEKDGGGFDLAGTCLGLVRPEGAITGSRVEAGDTIIGLRSSGIHSNGLTLARAAFGLTSAKPLSERRRIAAEYYTELGSMLGEELLRPTRIYVSEVLALLDEGVDVRGLAHMTTDGFLNLPRLEADAGYVIDALPEPHPIFAMIQDLGDVSDAEMYEVFNMGIGMCVIVPGGEAAAALDVLAKLQQEASAIGHVVADAQRTVDITPRRLRGRRHDGLASY